jgi:hypothetical protein
MISVPAAVNTIDPEPGGVDTPPPGPVPPPVESEPEPPEPETPID